MSQDFAKSNVLGDSRNGSVYELCQDLTVLLELFLDQYLEHFAIEHHDNCKRACADSIEQSFVFGFVVNMLHGNFANQLAWS